MPVLSNDHVMSQSISPLSPPPAPRTPDAGVLRQLLDDEGLGYDVSADGSLAVLAQANGVLQTLVPPARRHLVQLARRAGFTHVALEVLAAVATPVSPDAAEAATGTRRSNDDEVFVSHAPRAGAPGSGAPASDAACAGTPGNAAPAPDAPRAGAPDSGSLAPDTPR